MKESKSGRLSIFKSTNSIWVGDSLLETFLEPFEGKHVTLTVETEED